MSTQPFFIGPTSEGMIKAVEPWLLPDTAFHRLFNCYQFRGRIEKKYCSKQLGRLVQNIGGVQTVTNLPVMGLVNYETTDINQEKLIGFNTAQANIFDEGTQTFTDISFNTAGAAITWTGTNSDFFWGWNYWMTTANKKLLWVTNNVRADRIRYYDGTAAVAGVSGGWTTTFRPILDSIATPTRYLDTALLIVSMRGRLIFLNTKETAAGGPKEYHQRARWCQIGDPLQDDAWLDTTPGKGNYTDAPTAEAIVSCGFYKDTLVVFFERSTWQLVYTADSTAPFAWYRINTQFGSESTYSTISFDRGLFSVGNTGILVADSNNVERIDQKIPDQVFSFHNAAQGLKRVHGIRDFVYQFAYWTYPNASQNPTFPNRVLCYNYLEDSFSIFKDSFTCFGYYQTITDTTWATATYTWASATRTWDSGLNQSQFPLIVAGNQQGFVFNIYEYGVNDPSLYISGINAVTGDITSPNHNLEVGDFVIISDVPEWPAGTTVTGKISKITTNTINIGTIAAGTSGLITVLDNFEILTKRYNPFLNKGSKCRMNYMDMFIDRTNTGEFTIDYFVDETRVPIETRTVKTSQNYGTTSPEEKMMQRVFTSTQGQFIQMKMYFSDAQMLTPAYQTQDFKLHAMNLWMSDAGRITSYDHI